jgi:ABC-type polysaccharide/polyol phosphate transport system ATPase subunit
MYGITVSNLGKTFRDLAIPTQTTVKDAIFRRLWSRSYERRTVEAIRDLSFSLETGKVLGVIGRNGSGKTTLLRLLAGIYKADTGSIAIKGTVAPLLSIASGFHPDLTGRENARVGLLVLGFSPREIISRMKAIAAFAEIGDFLDAPVRAYSTGMMMRLGFAIAASAESDVLLLDEVLAVGDEVFARKCLQRIGEYRDKGKTMVLVTHDGNAIVKWCDVALWLEGGRARLIGDPKAIVDAYYLDSLPERERAKLVGIV